MIFFDFKINSDFSVLLWLLNFKIKYEAVPKSENHLSYEYPNKGKGFGDGNLMYVLKVNDNFLKVNEATFNEKEPLYSRLTSLNYFNISNRLLDINLDKEQSDKINYFVFLLCILLGFMRYENK